MESQNRLVDIRKILKETRTIYVVVVDGNRNLSITDFQMQVYSTRSRRYASCLNYSNGHYVDIDIEYDSIILNLSDIDWYKVWLDLAIGKKVSFGFTDKDTSSEFEEKFNPDNARYELTKLLISNNSKESITEGAYHEC